MIFTLSGSIFLNLNTPVWEQNRKKNHTLSGSKGSRKYTVVLSGSKNLKRVYPFGSIFSEDDTRLGSKNGKNYTLSSGTYPVPKTSKCPPPPGFEESEKCQDFSKKPYEHRKLMPNSKTLRSTPILSALRHNTFVLVRQEPIKRTSEFPYDFFCAVA